MSTTAAQQGSSTVSPTNPSPASAGLQLLRDAFAKQLPNPRPPAGHAHVDIVTTLDIVRPEAHAKVTLCDVLPSDDDIVAFNDEINAMFDNESEAFVNLGRAADGSHMTFCVKWGIGLDDPRELLLGLLFLGMMAGDNGGPFGRGPFG